MAKKNLVQFGAEIQLDTSDIERSERQIARVSKNIDRNLDRAEKATKDLEAGQKILNDRLKKGTITQEQYNKALSQLQYNATRAERAYERQQRALKKNNDELNRGKQIMASIGGRGAGAIAGVASGLLGGIGARSIINAGQERVRAEAQLRNNANLLGLGPAELARLERVFSKLTGQDKDSVSDSFKDIRERIGEIASESESSLGQAAKSIGLDAARLKGQRLPEQIRSIVETLGEIEDVETRLFRARELFGDEAANMLSGAAGDARKFRQLMRESLSIPLSMTDKEFEKLKESTSDYNDSLDRLNRSFAGFAPYIMDFISKMMDGTVLTFGGRNLRQDEVEPLLDSLNSKGSNGIGFDMTHNGHPMPTQAMGFASLPPSGNPYMSKEAEKYMNPTWTGKPKEYEYAPKSVPAMGLMDVGVDDPNRDAQGRIIIQDTRLAGMQPWLGQTGNQDEMAAWLGGQDLGGDNPDRDRIISNLKTVAKDLDMAMRIQNETREHYQMKWADEDQRQAISKGLGSGGNAGAGAEYEFLAKSRKAQREYEEQRKRDKERNQKLDEIDQKAADEIEVLKEMRNDLRESLSQSV